MRRTVAAMLAAATALTLATVTAPSSQGAATIVHVRLRTAIRHLPVKAHSHARSYSRTKEFGNWITQYGECDTRAVVLKDESLRRTTQNSYCTVSKGKWYSFYNARYYYDAYGGALQIDHVVPVENAWVSGAWRWTHATRVRYYNDLGDARTLVAVDLHDNEAKGDSDPTQWMPSHGHCRYLRYWVAVKTRWHLSVTSAEKAKLARVAAGCPNTLLTIHRAAVTYR
ncbi:MAG: HNH endonuclease family protein [Nocardioidaceae bacterium]